jgi:type VI secretion system protein ImpH
MSPSGSDLQSLTLSTTDKPPVLTVNFLGLGGIQGSLPTPYTEILVDRLRNKDATFKNFLNIFNHRLASFWHRMRKKIVLGIAQVHPEATPTGKSFLDLAGIDSDFLRNRLAVPDQALLAQAAVFWRRPRSLIGLQRLLRSYFGLPMVVFQFQGAWQVAQKRDWTRIGARESGQHQILGKSTILGKRSWHQTAGVAVHIPPLNYKQFVHFRKETALEFLALRDLIFFYIGEGQQVHLMFSLQKEHIMSTQLNGQFELGRTTWMTRGNGKGFSKDPEVKLTIKQGKK